MSATVAPSSAHLIIASTDACLAQVLHWKDCFGGEDENCPVLLSRVNEALIAEAHEAGELTCLMVGAHVIAYSMTTCRPSGNATLDILEVRPDERRRGFGGTLARHVIHALSRRGADRIRLQCSRSSERFWRALGFTDDLHASPTERCCKLHLVPVEQPP